MRRLVLPTLSLLLLQSTVAAVASPVSASDPTLSEELPAECVVAPKSCYTRVIPIGPQVQADDPKGRKVNDYNWAYDEVVIYAVCSSTTCTRVGSVRVTARINLNGRQSNWTQTIAPFDGPQIKGTNQWNCIDDNGNLPNSSCSGGGKSKTSPDYRRSAFSSSDSNFHSDDERYWYSMDWAWQALGEAGWTFTWRGWRSYVFRCDASYGSAACRFNQ